tara:strand:+ start:2071 stop:2241 length:171 start_codon:yes stop_codon:yes gene_type:complete
MKKQESYRYSIFCKEKLLYEGLTEEEYFDKLEELSQDFYINGVPHPEDLKTVILTD